MSNNIYITNHRNKEVDISPNEFYSTHPKSVQTFLDYFTLPKGAIIWECACGKGNISKVLIENGYDVISTDIIDRGYITPEYTEKDFFDIELIPQNVKTIMTNPPYSLAEKFVRHAMKILPKHGWLVLYLKLTFLEGKKRYKLFEEFPPEWVMIHSSRQACDKYGAEDFPNTGAVAYAWYIWPKGYKGPTKIRWLPPN